MEEAGEDTTEFTKNFKAEMDAMEGQLVIVLPL